MGYLNWLNAGFSDLSCLPSFNAYSDWIFQQGAKSGLRRWELRLRNGQDIKWLKSLWEFVRLNCSEAISTIESSGDYIGSSSFGLLNTVYFHRPACYTVMSISHWPRTYFEFFIYPTSKKWQMWLGTFGPHKEVKTCLRTHIAQRPFLVCECMCVCNMAEFLSKCQCIFASVCESDILASQKATFREHMTLSAHKHAHTRTYTLTRLPELSNPDTLIGAGLIWHI